MSSIRKRRNSRFTPLSNGLLQDKNLSFEARGMMAYLLSKPEGWETKPYDIEREGNIGKDARRRIMIEAEKAGYLTFHTNRKPNGQLESWYDAHEEPVPEPERTSSWETGKIKALPGAGNPQAVEGEKDDSPGAGLPGAGQPPAGQPGTGEPPAGKPVPLINKDIENKDIENKERERDALAFSPDGNPFTPEIKPVGNELKAERLFHIVHEGCNLPPKLNRKIEKRIYDCVDNLMLGGFSIPDVQAFIANWRRTKTIALTPERVASDIGEWRRLNANAAPIFEAPPRPDTKGMTVAEERRAIAEWFNECQRIKQQTGVAA